MQPPIFARKLLLSPIRMAYSIGMILFANNSSTPQTGIGNAMAHCIQLIAFIFKQIINIRCEIHQCFFIHNDVSIIWHLAYALVKYQTKYIYNIPSTKYKQCSVLIDLTKPYIVHTLCANVYTAIYNRYHGENDS